MLIFGASLSYGGGAMRFCLLENRILGLEEKCAAAGKCCHEEEGHSDDSPCCQEIKKLSESNLPSSSGSTPPFYAVELPLSAFAPLVSLVEKGAGRAKPPIEFSALSPPFIERAMLGIWTI